MHYNAVDTGKRIQKLRKNRGLTQEQLAEKHCRQLKAAVVKLPNITAK